MWTFYDFLWPHNLDKLIYKFPSEMFCGKKVQKIIERLVIFRLSKGMRKKKKKKTPFRFFSSLRIVFSL